MATSKFVVSGEQFIVIDDRMREIKRQLRQDSGSPLDPDMVAGTLQKIIEGNFGTIAGGVLVLTALVNHDDPAHRRIEKDEWIYINPNLGIDRLPISRTGTQEMEFELLFCPSDSKGWSFKDYFDEVARRGDLWVPDFAETRSFHRDHPKERASKWILSPCGSVVGGEVASVYANPSGLNLDLDPLDSRWYPRRRFLAVRKSR